MAPSRLISPCARRDDARGRVELPSQINLLINLKSAKRLGIEVPLSLLIRADELIE
jgi:ABC-type uncharacterized transport system substrate-binding protein